MGFGRIAWLVPCGSDEYDVVIKLSLFGWVTSGGDWRLRGEQCSWCRTGGAAETGRRASGLRGTVWGKFEMEGWPLGPKATGGDTPGDFAPASSYPTELVV
jgi:hypothetical protein